MPPPSSTSKRRRKKKRKDPWQLLVIGAFFILVGVTMVLAKRGELRPLPADHRGDSPSLAALSASDARAYGWFGIACGLSAVGFYVRLRLKPRE